MSWVTTRSSLLHQIRDGEDEKAWRRFERLYGEVIVRYAQKRGLQWDEAEDVRQIVFMSLLRALPKFQYARERGRFRSYLGTIVGNAIVRYRSKAHRQREIGVSDLTVLENTPAPGQVDELWEKEWVDHHLRVALTTLRTKTRRRSVEIFSRLLEGSTPEQVADELGMKRDAVYKVQQRVRRHLIRIVREQIESEEEALEHWAESRIA